MIINKKHHMCESIINILRILLITDHLFNYIIIVYHQVLIEAIELPAQIFLATRDDSYLNLMKHVLTVTWVAGMTWVINDDETTFNNKTQTQRLTHRNQKQKNIYHWRMDGVEWQTTTGIRMPLE